MTPSCTISGAEPSGEATTGVPVASASIITRPKGSAHCSGLSRATAEPSSSSFSAPPSSPTYSTSGPSSGRTSASKYARSAGSRSLAAIRSGTPAARAARTACRGPFSGLIRPRKQAYPPSPRPTGTSSTSMPWWMTAASGTPTAVEAWCREMATTGTPCIAR